jgi:hypothetical protein
MIPENSGQRSRSCLLSPGYRFLLTVFRINLFFVFDMRHFNKHERRSNSERLSIEISKIPAARIPMATARHIVTKSRSGELVYGSVSGIRLATSSFHYFIM